MRCWACSRLIELTDPVNELPIVNALVHTRCYERETGTRVRTSPPLSHYLRPRLDRAA